MRCTLVLEFDSDAGDRPSAVVILLNQSRSWVISDAKDLADLTDKLPHDSRWMLDWAHIGRKLWATVVRAVGVA
jgi:hypothetical protein